MSDGLWDIVSSLNPEVLILEFLLKLFWYNLHINAIIELIYMIVNIIPSFGTIMEIQSFLSNKKLV